MTPIGCLIPTIPPKRQWMGSRTPRSRSDKCRPTASGTKATAHGAYGAPRHALLANNFHQRSFSSSAVEFAIEDLLPRPEIQLPFANRHDNFATHNLALQMRVGIIYPGTMRSVRACRLLR